MNNNPMQFGIEVRVEFFSILLYPVDADENVTFDFTRSLRMAKGYDVGVGMMIKILDVDVPQEIVRTKDIV